MKITFRRTRTTSLVMGVASLVLGLVVFTNPTGVALFLTSMVGAVMAVMGVVTLLGYLRERAVASQIDLFCGVAELVFGALLWIWPGFFVNWLVVVVGVFILFTGLGDLMDARELSRAGSEAASVNALMGVLTVIFGLVVVAAPFALVDMMFAIAGVGLVFNGVTELWAVLRS